MIYGILIAYFLAGTAVCLLHPKLLRPQIVAFWALKLGPGGCLIKLLMALITFAMYCTLWPLAWVNCGKSERKNRERVAAELERLRPFMGLWTAMHTPVEYAGGDGSSFDTAIIIHGATLINGPMSAYTYIESRYPGAQRTGQSLLQHKGKDYDRIDFTTAGGMPKVLYFDITEHLQEIL